MARLKSAVPGEGVEVINKVGGGLVPNPLDEEYFGPPVRLTQYHLLLSSSSYICK